MSLDARANDVFDYEWKAVMENTRDLFNIVEWHANEIIHLKEKIIEQVNFLEGKMRGSSQKVNENE